MPIGISQLAEPTPKWVKLVFGSCLVLSNVAAFIIAGDTRIPPETKVQIGVYVNAFVMAVYGLGQLFGVPIKKETETESVEAKLENEKK
jgi:hypothetical protein